MLEARKSQRTHAKDGFEMGEDSTCVQECKRVSDMQDINMPIQDGLQATLQIRRIERGRLRRQASRASFGKNLALVGEGGHVSVLQRHCSSPSQTPVPIVGVSACGKSEQLGNAFASGLLHNGTGHSLFWCTYLSKHLKLACIATFNTGARKIACMHILG